MKKVILVLIICANYIPLNSQNIKVLQDQLTQNRQSIQNIQKLNSSDHPLVKKVFYQYDNYEKNDWVKYSETDYSYDISMNLREIVENRLSPRYDEFRLFSIEGFSYDNNLLIEKIHITHRDWGPIEMFRILYYYNDSDSLSEQIFQTTQDSGATWQNQMRYVFGYDENGNSTDFYFDVWENENWLVANEAESIFDSNGNLIQMVQKSCFQGECTNSDRYLYEYDENNNNIKFIYQRMQESGWENYSQNIMEYDNENILTIDIFQHWDADENVWYNASKDFYEYDTSDNLVSKVHYNWDYFASNPDWIYSQRYSYKYQDGFKIEEIYEAYDNEWINQSKTVYTYEGITEVENSTKIANKFELAQNYPNPFNPSTIINYTIPNETHPFIPSREGKERSDRGVLVIIKVYDILGKEVATLVNENKQPGNYEVAFDASDLQSGVYFYRLRAGDASIGSAQSFIETKKMVLLR